MKGTYFLSVLAAALLVCSVAGANTDVSGSSSDRSKLPDDYYGANDNHASQGVARVFEVETGGYEYLVNVNGGNSKYTTKNCRAEISGGNVMMLYGGQSGRDATDNFVYMSGGTVAELQGAFGGGEVSNNVVVVTGGIIGAQSDYWVNSGYVPGQDHDLDGVYGGYSWVMRPTGSVEEKNYVASNNAVHLVGGGFTGDINGVEYTNTAPIVVNAGVHGGYSSLGQASGNSIDIYGTGISAKYMADVERLTFHMVDAQAGDPAPMISLGTALNLDELLKEPLHLMGETVTDWAAFEGKTVTLITDENGISITPASNSYIASLAKQDPGLSDAAALYSIRNAKKETVATGILSVTADGKSLVLSDITPGAQRLVSHYISPPHSTTTRGLSYHSGALIFTSTEGQQRKEVVKVESDFYGTDTPPGEHDAQVLLLYNLHTNTNWLQSQYAMQTVNAESYELVVEGDDLQYSTIRNAVVVNQPDPCSLLIHVGSGYVAIEGLVVEARCNKVEITAPDGIYFAALPHTDDPGKYYTGNSFYYYSDAEPGTNKFGTDTPFALSSNGKITLGENPKHAEGTHVLNGQWEINYTGCKGKDWDVDVLCKVVGGLNVSAPNGGVNAGIVEGDATVEARAVYLTSLWGGNASFRATESVTIDGIDTSGYVEVGGTGSARPEILVKADLIAQRHIRLAGSKVQIGCGLGAANNDACIESAGDVAIGTFTESPDISFTGGTLNVSAGGDVALDGSIAATGTGKWKEDGTEGGDCTVRLQGAAIAARDIGADTACLRSTDGDITIGAFTGGALKASANGDVIIRKINSSGAGRWKGDGTEGGDCAIHLQGKSIEIKQDITSTNAACLRSTDGNIIINAFTGGALKASAAGDIVMKGNVHINGEGGSRVSITPGSMVRINGKLNVEKGTLDIMNISEAASLSVADVTIGNAAAIGVYTGENAQEAYEGTLAIAGGRTLAAGAGARLNADLVMEDGSTLDVSAAGGSGGLLMGSAVTMSLGGVTLSDADMSAVMGLDFMQAYDLFSGVDRFCVDDREITVSGSWVNAAELFSNPEFTGEKDYYVLYSAANPGGRGGNVGTIYIMQVPEPATGTLSLLALAVLAARRRRGTIFCEQCANLITNK